MLERSMKVEYVNEKYVKITGDRGTGKSMFAKALIDMFTKFRVNDFMELIECSNRNPKFIEPRGKKYALLLDEVDYKGYEEIGFDVEKLKEGAIFVVEVIKTSDKNSKEQKDKEFVEITEKTKKLMCELDEMRENLAKVSALNKKYSLEYNSELTEKLGKAILYKESEILSSLNLTK